jgi:hypothetical protein
MSRLAAMDPPSARLVTWVVLASIAITAFHFTDNFVSIETYPQPDWVTRGVVLASWPLLTAVGIAGVVLYRGGRPRLGSLLLLAYAYTGISSLGHFASGSPDEFTTRGLISVFVDGLAGASVLAVGVWAALANE